MANPEHVDWLPVPHDFDDSGLSVKKVVEEHEGIGGSPPFTMYYLPIDTYIERDGLRYPINGDAVAQRIHWESRDERGRAEMRAILARLGAWRLNDDGTLPASVGQSIPSPAIAAPSVARVLPSRVGRKGTR
jgi:hypothetical protein